MININSKNYIKRVIDQLKPGKDFRVVIFDKQQFVLFTKDGFEKFVSLMAKEMMKEKLNVKNKK